MCQGLQARRRVHDRGFSLVELMVSVAIGLIVVTAAIAGLSNLSRTAAFGEAIAALEDDAQFALEELTESVRTAGFAGCTAPGRPMPGVPGGAAADMPRRAVTGSVYASGAWGPHPPGGYDGSPNPGYAPPSSGRYAPVEGTDGFEAQGAIGSGTTLATGFDHPTLLMVNELLPGFDRGELIVVADCASASIRKLNVAKSSAHDDAGRLIVSMPFTFPFIPDSTYPEALRVYPYRRAFYFVGETGRTTVRGEPVRALFEHRYPYDAPPMELAPGVEAMIVHYRQMRLDGAITEVRATDSAYDPNRVIAARIALLVSSDAHVEQADPPGPIDVAGVSIAPAATLGPGYPDDRRVRRVVSRVVAVRNWMFGEGAS